MLSILLYHGVAPRTDSGIFNYRKKFVTPESFDKHISYLKKHYTLLDLDKAARALQNGEELPPYPLVITFDDGYKNTLEFAAPILQKHNAPATIFVVTNYIDKKIPLWVDRLEYVIGHGKDYANKTYAEKIAVDDKIRNELKTMTTHKREERLQQLEQENKISLTSSEETLYAPISWKEMVVASEDGINFGAHTENHPILTKLPIEEARTEIGASLRALERHVKKSSKVFAYPNGQPSDYNEDIKRSVKELGFIGALTTVPGTSTIDTDMYELKRYTMDGTNSMISFTMRLTGTLDWFRKLLKI